MTDTNKLINNGDQIVFSVFEFNSLNIIETVLKKDINEKRRLYYQELALETDIVPMRGGRHYPKVVFFIPKTNPNVIIQYANYFDGWFTLSNYISKSIKEHFYLISFSNKSSYYKAFSLSLYQEGSIKRIIRAMQDPKWIFNNSGDILPIENADYYTRKKISDRINKEIIIEYCQKLKLDISDNNFWKSNVPALFYETIKW